MRLTRRQACRAGALAGGAVFARLASGGAARVFAQAPPAATPKPAASAARFSSAETIDLLREFILQRALTSDDPWVQAHVVLALGADELLPPETDETAGRTREETARCA